MKEAPLGESLGNVRRSGLAAKRRPLPLVWNQLSMSVTVNAGEAETVGEPDEGKLHVRFDEGRLGTDRLPGLWRPTRRWVTAGECSSALNAVPHQPPTPQVQQGVALFIVFGAVALAGC